MRTPEIVKHPDFVETLRFLIEVHGYSTSVVGEMFGFSHSYCHRLCQRNGIEIYSRGVRMWSDTMNCFVRVDSATYRLHRRKHRTQRLARWRFQRRMDFIHLLDRLRTELKREPNWIEIFEAAWPNRPVPENRSACAPILIQYFWGTSNRKGLTMRALLFHLKDVTKFKPYKGKDTRYKAA